MTPRLRHATRVPMTLPFVAGHVEEARRRGFEVHVLSSPGAALDTFARDLRVPAPAVPMAPRSPPAAQHSRFAARAWRMARRIAPLADLAALGRMVRVMRRVRPTIVDAHTPKAG